MEASLSVLNDGSAGFEPPAPPTVESDRGQRSHHFLTDDNTVNTAYNHQRNSDKHRGSRGMDGNREGRDEDRSTGGEGSSNDRSGEGTSDVGGRRGEVGRNGNRGAFGERRNFQTEGTAISPTGDNYPGDNHRSTHEHAVTSAAAVGSSHDMESNLAPKVPGNGYSDRGGTGVLRGVSAAKASGALPVAARPNPNTSSAGDQNESSIAGGRKVFPGEEENSDRLPRVANDDANRAGGRRLDSAGVFETTAAGGGDGGGRGVARQESSGGGDDPDAGFDDQVLTGNWRQDERGEQARRHIDEALRQRAQRRRNRCAALSK